MIRRRRSLVDIWAKNLTAAGPLTGDLVETVREHCIVQDAMAEVDALQAAIIDESRREQNRH